MKVSVAILSLWACFGGLRKADGSGWMWVGVGRSFPRILEYTRVNGSFCGSRPTFLDKYMSNGGIGSSMERLRVGESK